MPLWPRPATTSGSSWPGSGLCAPFSGRLSWSGMTRAAPPPHPPEHANSLFHRRRDSSYVVRDGAAEFALGLVGMAPVGVGESIETFDTDGHCVVCDGAVVVCNGSVSFALVLVIMALVQVNIAPIIVRVIVAGIEGDGFRVVRDGAVAFALVPVSM